MKKINYLLRKCKSLSRQLGRSSSYSSLRSKSTREDLWVCGTKMEEEDFEQQKQQLEKVSGNDVILYVGSTRKRYAISSKYLSHPLLNALIDKSKSKKLLANDDDEEEDCISVRCEVVLFDHLLWMLENSDPNISFDSNLEELAELYVF
ncbi:auxin-responsive protein SAUR78 [Benincasa hispida]|uniref:auxin-responsive protein SAUR78 n=1 Tax=Benincasa hispida TaxID=102211 RepID=UPI0018FF2EAF|nr:auxin-responsive protein SAUR78 [Benincasa hispida]